MRFSDLVGVSDRPVNAEPAIRRPISDGPQPVVSPDIVNNGLLSGLFDSRRNRKVGATRRTFLRSTVAAAAASAAVNVIGLFGPSRTVAAQTGVIGTYPRRLLTYCPPYNSGDNCQPGCGSSPICTDCCDRDGYFRNDPANGYTLYPGGCGDGDIADGWIWRYNDVCGNCSTIEYRCSDGYVETDTGPAPFICRVVTECVPLAEGQDANHLPDAATQTGWQPAGALERAVDNGGSVSLTGWIADADGQPVDMRILVNGQIVHVGKAALSRPDIAAGVRGAGPNTGYAVSFPIDPGPYKFCVNALKGGISVTIGCVDLDVGSGRSVSGGSASTVIGGLPAAEPEPTPDTSTDASGDGSPGADPDTASQTSAQDTTDSDQSAGTAVASAVPDPTQQTPSPSPSRGAAQVIRRSSASQGFVSGWAGDADTERAPWIEVLVDDESAAVLRPELPRPDVAAAYPQVGPATGFAGSFDLPADEAMVCVDVVDPQDGQRQSLGCRRLGAAIDPEPDPVAADRAQGGPTVDGARTEVPDLVWGAVDTTEVVGTDIIVRGWAVAPNDRERIVDLRLILDGIPNLGATGLVATESARRFGYDQPCGFELSAPASSGEHTVVVEAATHIGSHVLGEATVTVP